MLLELALLDRWARRASAQNEPRAARTPSFGLLSYVRIVFMKRGIEPLGYTHGRVLTEQEVEQISGDGHSTGTLTGGGGGVPGPIHVNPDYDYDYEW